MTTLTLICAADSAGKFIDPKTGKPWNIAEDREFFRGVICGETIICGRETFLADWRGFMKAERIVVLSGALGQPTTPRIKDDLVFAPVLRQMDKRAFERPERGDKCRPDVWISSSPLQALIDAKFSRSGKEPEEVFCAGGKKTIEALAPFASRMLLTHIGTKWEESVWLPEAIMAEVNIPASDPYEHATLWENAAGDNFYGKFYDGTEEESFYHLDLSRWPQINF